jgi:hypothetical protein
MNEILIYLAGWVVIGFVVAIVLARFRLVELQEDFHFVFLSMISVLVWPIILAVIILAIVSMVLYHLFVSKK